MEFKLIVKKLNNNLTAKEEVLFNKWYNESQLHREYFDKVKNISSEDHLDISILEGWKAIEKKINKPEKNRNLWKYAVAASIIILIGTTIFFSYYNPPVNFPDKENPVIVTGTNKVILTLENGSDIPLKKGEIYQSENLTSNGDQLIYLNKDKKHPNNKVVYNSLTIPRGSQIFLQLSDSTKIWLNSDSKIKYPKNFIKGNPRNVELVYGEAYFEVTHSEKNRGSKFNVKTATQKVTVLGTKFNIKAYKEEDYIYTTLVKGSVTVDNKLARTLLKPDYQSVVGPDNPKITVLPVDTDKAISWIKGEFSFRNKPLSEITKVLSRWYDVQFIFINEDLKNIEFSGVIEKRQNIQTILSILETNSSIKYEVKERVITFK